MKYFCFAFALFFCQNMNGQNVEWFAPGARWITDFDGFGGYGYDYIEVEGQEMVNGQICTKLKVKEAWFSYISNNWNYYDGFPIFGFTRNDTVFVARNNDFDIIYDFTLAVGDTIWNLPGEIQDFGIVQAAGDTVLFGNLQTKFLEIALTANWSPPHVRITRIYEGIGGNHFKNWDAEPSLDEPDYRLSCYRDDAHAESICQLISNQEPPIWANEVQIFPNPTTGNSILKLPAAALPATVSLVDFLGKTYFSENVEQSDWPLILRKNLPAGIYFLKIRSKTGEVASRKVVFQK